ncbi:MAG: hypothetical protein ACXWUN_04930 [Allosphingosinicella sp.]
MRKLLFSVALATATLAAVPAAAQYQNSGWDRSDRSDRSDQWDRSAYGDRQGPDRRAVAQLVRQLDQVDNRIARSAQRRIISPREANGLRREAAQVRNRIYRSGRDGLSGREFASLRVQVNRLEQRLHVERRDHDGRRG